MPSPLTTDDFKLFSATCEVRYKPNFFIYDRTGQIGKSLDELFTNLNVSTATPQQSLFTADEGSFGIELAASRCTIGGAASTEVFADYSHKFFAVITKELNVNLFTRIGLRYVLRKNFKAEDDARAALASMALANLKPSKRFNSSDSPVEVLFRWEDSQIGAFVRLKAEGYDINVAIPAELKDAIPKFDKRVVGLTLDIDYYTVAPVEREQWNCREWIQQKVRIIRKEVDGIIQGGR